MRKFTKLTVLLVIAFAFTIYYIVDIPTKASNDKHYVSILLNGEYIEFPDQKPFIDTESNRTLVPIRFIAEAIENTTVEWTYETKTVEINSVDRKIILSVGSPTAYVNGLTQQIDSLPKLINDRTMVPLRFVAESLGAIIEWDAKSRTVNLKTNSSDSDPSIELSEPIDLIQISMEDSKDKVLATLGEPARQDLSEYGFQWFIYNQDYSKYIQVGIKDGKTVALYTNSNHWNLLNDISIEATRQSIRTNYGKPLEYIVKGRTRYSVLSSNEQSTSDVYLINNNYVTFFYDAHENYKVSSIYIIEKNMETSFHRYGSPSDALQISYERQMVDIANATRAKFSMPPFMWSDSAAIVARKHSSDMMNKNYFAHDTPDGKTLASRFNDSGIRYRLVAENIAAGQQSAIHAHESLMNSIGHRQNILGDFRYLGVGVVFGGSYNVYYTQNFLTPR